MPTTDPEPVRGRPRSAAADQAILDAAVDLLGESGINKMSMDRLAQRAGVAKATIYRRWPSKEVLVLDALQSVIHPIDDVDTGDLRGDLAVYLDELGRRMASGPARDILPHLIEAAVHDDALRESLDAYTSSRRQPLLSLLRRAVARGEIGDDVDLDVVADVLVGPFIYRSVVRGQATGPDFVAQILSFIVPRVAAAR